MPIFYVRPAQLSYVPQRRALLRTDNSPQPKERLNQLVSRSENIQFDLTLGVSQGALVWEAAAEAEDGVTPEEAGA